MVKLLKRMVIQETKYGFKVIDLSPTVTIQAYRTGRDGILRPVPGQSAEIPREALADRCPWKYPSGACAYNSERRKWNVDAEIYMECHGFSRTRMWLNGQEVGSVLRDLGFGQTTIRQVMTRARKRNGKRAPYSF
jgi:hypothetical protein